MIAGRAWLYLAWLLLLGGCTAQPPLANGPHPVVKRQTIEQVQHEQGSRLMDIPGVVGTGVGQCDGQPCIVVFVREDSPALRRAVPTQLGGYPVRIEVTGEIRALPKRKR